MNTNYLDLDFKTASFFHYSKEEKEGYEKHTASSGNVSYRKFFKKGVYGILQSASLQEGKFGYQISLRLRNGDEVYVCNVSLHNQSRNIDNNFAEPLICLLPNLVKNQAYRLYPYSMVKEFDDGNSKTFYGISIKFADLDKEEALDSVAPAFRRRKKEEAEGPNQVPSLVFEKKLTGLKPTLASIGAREDFLEALLEKSLVPLAYEGNNQEPAKKTTTAPVEDTPTPPRVSKFPSTSVAPKTSKAMEPAEVKELYTEDDDLPF